MVIDERLYDITIDGNYEMSQLIKQRKDKILQTLRDLDCYVLVDKIRSNE